MGCGVRVQGPHGPAPALTSEAGSPVRRGAGLAATGWALGRNRGGPSGRSGEAPSRARWLRGPVPSAGPERRRQGHGAAAGGPRGGGGGGGEWGRGGRPGTSPGPGSPMQRRRGPLASLCSQPRWGLGLTPLPTYLEAQPGRGPSAGRKHSPRRRKGPGAPGPRKIRVPHHSRKSASRGGAAGFCPQGSLERGRQEPSAAPLKPVACTGAKEVSLTPPPRGTPSAQELL